MKGQKTGNRSGKQVGRRRLGRRSNNRMTDQDQTTEMLKLCLQKICELQAEIEQGENSVADPEAEGYTACAMETLRFLSDQGLTADHPLVQTLTERLTRSRD